MSDHVRTAAAGGPVTGAARARWAKALPLLAAGCSLVLAACGGSSSSSAAGTGSTSSTSSSSGNSGTNVVIGYENNGADPSMISVAQNTFKKEINGNVQLKLFTSGPAALSAIASGSLQFMCGLGVPPAISAIARKVPLVVVWNQERYTTDAGIVVKKTSGITSLAGLKGQTIAITTGSEASFELPELLKVTNSGISVSSVHQLNMSPPQMQSAWATGQIKAAIVWDPTFNYLATHGGRVIATDASLPVNASSYNVCVANKPFVQAHPQVAAGFIKAMADGVNYASAHPSQALAIMAKQSGVSESTAKTDLAGYHIYSVADQITPAVLGQGSGVAQAGTTQSMTNNWQVLYKAGFLSSPPPSDMAAFVDSSFAKAAQGSS